MRYAGIALAVLLFACPGAASGEAPAGVPASTCRALINVTGRPIGPGHADADAEADHFVVDLRFGAEIRAESARGLVVRDGATTWALELVGHRRSDTGPAGTTMDRSWNDLVATRLPDGEPAVWIDGEPELTFPDPGRDHPYEGHRIHAVTGVVGPYVSVEQSSHGYFGGPHDSTWAKFFMVSPPAGERTSLDFLGPKAMAAMVAEVRAQSEARRATRGDSEEDLVPPGDLAETGLSFDDQNRLLLPAVLFCCTWAENHNTLYVYAPLPEVPPPLESHLILSEDPEESDEALVEAPDGCGAVGLSSDLGLAVRRGRSGELAAVGVQGLRAEGLLGVYWLDPEDPFRTSMLPVPGLATGVER